MNIRRMTQNDIASLATLEVRCFTVPWSYAMLQDELENENALYLIAEKEGIIVGYAGAWRILDEGHITNIAVDPIRQREGIGRQLLAALLEGLAGSGVQKATLEVRKSNAAAVALYQAFDFRVAGVRRAYYSDNLEDALIMWVNIDTTLKIRSIFSKF